MIILEKLETNESYFSKLIGIKKEMELNGFDLSNKVVVQETLNTLLMKFDHVVAMIQETKDLSTMAIKELQGSLIFYEQRINEKLKDGAGREMVENALHV